MEMKTTAEEEKKKVLQEEEERGEVHPRQIKSERRGMHDLKEVDRAVL